MINANDTSQEENSPQKRYLYYTDSPLQNANANDTSQEDNSSLKTYMYLYYTEAEKLYCKNMSFKKLSAV